MGVFYVTGNGTARLLNQLPSKYKKQMIVINSTNAGRITNRNLYPAVIDINSRNYNAGKWLAEKLNNPLPMRLPANSKPKSAKKFSIRN